MRFLNIGGPVALAIIGAILFFAVDVDFSGFEISTVGIILMVGAAVWFVVGIAIAASVSSKEKTVAAEQTVVERPAETRTTIER